VSGVTRTLVVIPTYNERGNIEGIVSRVLAAAPVDVLIVDDQSPDGTGEAADALSRADPRVSVMHRSGKQGLGAAYIAGFTYGIENGYDLLVEMDADGSHPPDALPDMLQAAAPESGLRVGAVIGSRWVPGGAVVNWPRHRELISRGGSAYARLMLGLPVRDVTAGFRVYRSDVVEAIDYRSVVSRGYCFQIDLTRRVVALGLPVVEVPIVFREREVGESKMNRAIVVEAMLKVTEWGIERIVARFRPEKERTSA
jgi:dolichol-phosphate mannosyltransferase